MALLIPYLLRRRTLPHTEQSTSSFCFRSQWTCPIQDLFRSVSPASPKPIADISVTATSMLKNKPLPARSQANTWFEVHVLKTHRKFQTDSSGRFSYSTNDNCGLFTLACVFLPFDVLFLEQTRKYLVQPNTVVSFFIGNWWIFSSGKNTIPMLRH